jgi:hypothetical protein
MNDLPAAGVSGRFLAKLTSARLADQDVRDVSPPRLSAAEQIALFLKQIEEAAAPLLALDEFKTLRICGVRCDARGPVIEVVPWPAPATSACSPASTPP